LVGQPSRAVAHTRITKSHQKTPILTMKTLRREIHPQIRVLDAKTGLVEYVASSERLDSFQEAIKADGWRFDDFQKNAPFVDSHDYSSIDKLLGRVVDFKVQSKRLIETVKWAIDVASNFLAQKGFEMTAAGYLKAVSVGFVPVETSTPYDDKTRFTELCEEMGIPADGTCQRIYLECQQRELSACVIGANPDALVNVERARAAGVLRDSDIERFSQLSGDFARAFEQHRQSNRSYSFSSSATRSGYSPPESASRSDFLHRLSAHYPQFQPENRAAFESLEVARRTGNATELQRAVDATFRAVARERRLAFGNPVVRYLDENPERRFFWNGAVRKLAGCLKIDSQEARVLEKAVPGIIGKAVSGINLQDTFGAGMLMSIPIWSGEIWDLLLHYGQYKDLGLRKMVGAYTKYPRVTGFPNAAAITPTQQGQVTLQPDTSLTGDCVTPDANTVACLIQASIAWLQDEKVDLSEVIVSKMVMGLAARIDYMAFQGSGMDDPNNGLTLGIFTDPNVANVQAPVSETSILKLQRQDFIQVLEKLNPAALQRMEDEPPRWYIHPSFIWQLLQLYDARAMKYLLHTPAETQGEWHLVGFPVTWAAQAPAVVAPAARIAVFGNPDAYLIALHEDFEITMSEKGADFGMATKSFRAIARGKSMMRDASGFAALQLAGE